MAPHRQIAQRPPLLILAVEEEHPSLQHREAGFLAHGEHGRAPGEAVSVHLAGFLDDAFTDADEGDHVGVLGLFGEGGGWEGGDGE